MSVPGFPLAAENRREVARQSENLVESVPLDGDPRQNALLKQGNKSDPVEARKSAELLPLGSLTRVYHGSPGMLQGAAHSKRSFPRLVLPHSGMASLPSFHH